MYAKYQICYAANCCWRTFHRDFGTNTGQLKSTYYADDKVWNNNSGWNMVCVFCIAVYFFSKLIHKKNLTISIPSPLGASKKRPVLIGDGEKATGRHDQTIYGDDADFVIAGSSQS